MLSKNGVKPSGIKLPKNNQSDVYAARNPIGSLNS